MRENMLPVIEKFTGTEYSTAGFVITAILLLLITGFAGYITGKSAAESFGGNKKKTAVVFTVTAVLTMAALLCFFGASAKAARGGVMCIIMLYAAYEDIKTRECADFLSVTLGITGIIGKEPKELILSLIAFAGIFLILLLSSVITKNGIGGGDVKFAGAAALVLGFFNTARAVYYITEENDGLYPEAERNTFTMNILTGGRKSAAAFTGDKSLEKIIEYSARKTTNSRALPVLTGIRRLDCPVTFFPLSVNGARQMRIISVREHRRIITENILKAKYKPPEKNYYDAAEKILIGIDMDIPRMETAAEYGVHIFLLDWQVNAVKEILRGKRAVLHPLTTETAEEMLRLPKDKAILLVRGAKPLLLNKITPEEHPSFKLLKYCKAAEHIPAWKLKKPEKTKNKKVPQYKMQFEMPLDTDEDEKESFDLSDGIDCRKLQTVKERDI